MNTLLSWISHVLGVYTPTSYIEYIYDFQGQVIGTQNTIPAGLAGVDWQYIVTALFLLITIYSVFRLLGVLLQAFSGIRS